MKNTEAIDDNFSALSATDINIKYDLLAPYLTYDNVATELGMSVTSPDATAEDNFYRRLYISTTGTNLIASTELSGGSNETIDSVNINVTNASNLGTTAYEDIFARVQYGVNQHLGVDQISDLVGTHSTVSELVSSFGQITIEGTSEKEWKNYT